MENSKRYARDNLTGSWLRSGAVHPIDISVAAGTSALVVKGRRRCWIGAYQYSTAAAAELYGLGTGQKQTVKHVVEFCPDFELDVALAVHEKVTTQAHRFCGLPLPAVIVEVGRRFSELARRGIDPGVRVQHEILGWIDAMAVRVFQ